MKSRLQKISCRYREYQTKKQEWAEKLWFRFLNLLWNLLLACGTVLPMMYKIITTIPFTYEVNDDATIAQILDGSYTGVPNAHGIFIKYPLSWIMSLLYKKNPSFSVGGISIQDGNWYVGVIVILEIFALVVVLFRLLNYFACNRLLLCCFFDLGFLVIWLPCFSNLTFSTAAAFLGGMALLFFSFETQEEAWRPWNLLILGILFTASYCLRKQCLYMVAPFLLIEWIIKYNIQFFKSVRPWLIGAFCVILSGGILAMNAKAYESQSWKQYFIYNHARAYLQDYVGFPEYEEEQTFYSSIGIDETQRNAMARYSYCMVKDFDTRWVEKIYLHVKEKEEKIDLKRQLSHAKNRAKKYVFKKNQTGTNLKYFSFYFWICTAGVFILTVIVCRKEGVGVHICNLLRLVGFCGLLLAEWIYLAMNGRFPQRVEEAIRFLMFVSAIALLGQFLVLWKKIPFYHLCFIVQILAVGICLQAGIGEKAFHQVKGKQNYYMTYGAEKSEVLAYCGKHSEDLFVLDTMSFTKMSRPSDDLHQGNWFMSGSWAAYTPLYKEKLKSIGIENLGEEFLTKGYVYVITKGKKNMASLLGIEEKERVEAEIVDEISTSQNSFFEVYKIKKVN